MIKQGILQILVILGMTHISTASSHTIPFRLINNLIVFHATVEGRSGNFILDSGASDLVLNQAYFEGNVQPVGGGHFQSIHGEAQSNRVDHIQLHLQGLSLRSYAVVMDLRPLEKTKRMNILGLAGLLTFQQYEVVIDYFSQNIILNELDRKGNRLLEEPLSNPSATLTFRYKEHIPYISMWIDQKELKLGLDTGVETNVLSTQQLAWFRGRIDVLGSKIVMGINGRTSYAPSAQIKDLRVGQLRLPAMETIFMSIDPLNRLPGTDLDGLLGLEFLKHFRTAINFKKKEVYFWNEEAMNQESLSTGRS